MTSFLSNAYVVLFSRIVLGTVFIIASLDKIIAPDAFAANILAYKILPYAMVNMFALLLPWIELLCGVFLLAGVLVRPSSFIISSLLVVFVIAIVAALAQDLKIDCGCFGKDHATPIGWDRVLEDIGLLFLGIHLVVFPFSKWSIEGLRPDRTEGSIPPM